MEKYFTKKMIFRIRQYLFLTLGVVIMASAFYFFIIPSDIVTGGTTGLAMIVVRYFPDWPISVITFVFNAFLLLCALIFLGKKVFLRSLYGSLLFPVFLGLFEWLIPSPVFRDTDLLLVALYAGTLIGVGFAIVLHNGGTTGGSDIPIQILSKYTKLSIGTSMYFVDGSIIILGAITALDGLQAGFITLLYAIAIVFLSGKMSDSMLLGMEAKRAVNIVTDHPEELKKAMFSSFSRGMTEIASSGAYSGTNKTILIMVIHTSEYQYIKRIIEDTDPKAFVYVTPASEISGEWSDRYEVFIENEQSKIAKKTK